jgi:hypothetical protein
VKGQAGFRGSLLEMQGRGAWLFWSRDQKRRHDQDRGGEVLGAGGGREGESCRQGSPCPKKPLPVKTARGAPRVVRKAVERSGGQSWLGKPFQLLVLLQFPHPAERRGRSQRGGWRPGQPRWQ